MVKLSVLLCDFMPKFAYYHNESEGCGEIGFYVTENKKRGDYLCASEVIKLDGTQPEPCDMIQCYACGGYIGMPMLQNLHPIEEYNHRPPWVEFPDYKPGCSGFRMGGGEDYIDRWWLFWNSLSIDEKNTFKENTKVPSGWEMYCT